MPQMNPENVINFPLEKGSERYAQLYPKEAMCYWAEQVTESALDLREMVGLADHEDIDVDDIKKAMLVVEIALETVAASLKFYEEKISQSDKEQNG